MSSRPAFKSVRIHLLGREFPLRVTPETEAFTLEVAELVDESFRAAHKSVPKQPDLTYAVLGALRLGEEVLEARREVAALRTRLQELQAEVARTTEEIENRLDVAMPQTAKNRR
ncbi:hypothetical protein BH23BAC4_BH23BAC4_15560 [soil metagenome]